ncbi:MAG: hypothetical protein MUC96_09125 [Myxococcaceae bacterium]|jgi:hypothetical protein|nr:hypothetical protein [Myxococcaceae bacterium]
MKPRADAVPRIALGAYLAVHFLMLLPFGTEVFSNEGVFPAEASPLLHLFPNVLALSDAPWAVTGLLLVGVLAAMALVVGTRQRVAALVCWYVWACLFGRTPLISNPSIPYVGLLLMALAARPVGTERLSRPLFTVVWVLMALGYSYSGWTKLDSASWLDGSAIAHVLEGPLARPGGLQVVLLALPPVMLRVVTWGVLGLELAFAPLACVARLRPWLWATMLALHVGLVVLIDFADLSLGMVLLHLFTFDPRWLPRRAFFRAVRRTLARSFVPDESSEVSPASPSQPQPRQRALSGETAAAMLRHRP